MTATARVLDFRPRYDGDELDRLAREVAEVLAPVTGQSAAEIALTTRRLLQEVSEDEEDLPAIREGQIVVNRDDHDDLGVYLELGVVMPVDDRSHSHA